VPKRKILGSLPPVGRTMATKHKYDRFVEPIWKSKRRDDKPKAGGLLTRLRIQKKHKGRK
jgi:hypothetical protein